MVRRALTLALNHIRFVEDGDRFVFGGPRSQPEPRLNQLATWLESNSGEAIGPALELVREANAEGDPPAAPEWIQILPKGDRTKGRDGRQWDNPDPQKLVDRFNRAKRPIPVDIEHMSELSLGESARAIGWVEEMAIRRGSTWARVEWNVEGESLVANRAFRYISPTLMIDAESNSIQGFSSVAITNHPNLPLRALNRKTDHDEPCEDSTMDKALLKALGLSEDATPEQARNAAKALAEKAANAEKAPPLDQYVPRGDYESERNKRAEAEAKLADREKADKEAAIEAAVNKATEECKITPAQREQAIAMCRASGVEAFEAFVNAGQKVVENKQVAPVGTAEDTASTLTEDQLAACKVAGIKPEDFIRERNKLAS